MSTTSTSVAPLARLLAHKAGPALLWDGAIGTELIAAGLDLTREPPEAWTLSRPDVLQALHARYLAAGASVIQTNTFGANRPRLVAGGLAERIAEVNSGAVRLARAAGATQVVASCGPTGIDPYSADAAARIGAAYEEQVRLLVSAGVDAVHFETMYHPVEALAGVAAARRVAPSLPVIVSATFALGDQGFQTPLGVALRPMMEAVVGARPDAVGLNCSLEARKILGAVRLLRDLTDLPIVARPQAGEPSVVCKGEVRGDDPARFARDTRKLADEGADAVGGCCGAGPDHIAALARALAEAALGAANRVG